MSCEPLARNPPQGCPRFDGYATPSDIRYGTWVWSMSGDRCGDFTFWLTELETNQFRIGLASLDNSGQRYLQLIHIAWDTSWHYHRDE